jgi:hypothetical protein
MAVGTPLSKAQMDADLSTAFLTLRNAFRRIEQLRHCTLIHPDADFLAIGYVQAEVNLLKGATVDGDNLRLGWQGAIALPQLDYRLNMDQLCGDLVT